MRALPPNSRYCRSSSSIQRQIVRSDTEKCNAACGMVNHSAPKGARMTGFVFLGVVDFFEGGADPMAGSFGMTRSSGISMKGVFHEKEAGGRDVNSTRDKIRDRAWPRI